VYRLNVPLGVLVLAFHRSRQQVIHGRSQLRRARADFLARLAQALGGEARVEPHLVGRHQEAAGIAAILVIVLGYEAVEPAGLGIAAQLEPVLVPVAVHVKRRARGVREVAALAGRRAQHVVVVVGAE
jgi:hypothetical protein